MVPTIRTSLTFDEHRLLVRAVDNLYARYGTCARVADAMGTSQRALFSVRCHGKFGSMQMVEIAARLLKTTPEDLLAGVPRPTSACPACRRPTIDPCEE
ncbi:MAG: hypothetical protein ACHREM_24710 [Polyangiales bacterium]